MDASKSVLGISAFLSFLSSNGSQKFIRNWDPYGSVASPTIFPFAKFVMFLNPSVNPIPSKGSELSSIDLNPFFSNALDWR